MGRSELLGPFEFAVMAAVIRCGSQAYGVTIHQDVVEAYEQHVALAAVYGTLNRLKAKGMISDRLDGADASRAGRRRRYVEVTGAGRAAVDRTRDHHARVVIGLESTGMASL